MTPEQTRAAVQAAARQWDWPGRAVGPVDFGGVRFWAVANAEAASGIVHLAGIVVTGRPWQTAIQEASYLAGYCPRGILAPGRRDITDLLIETAVLDQGLAFWDRRTCAVSVAATPGPRTGTVGGGHEPQLLSAVRAALEQTPPRVGTEGA